MQNDRQMSTHKDLKKIMYLTYGTLLFLFFGSTVENLQITELKWASFLALLASQIARVHLITSWWFLLPGPLLLLSNSGIT